jgi:hypothetical protein
LPAGLSRQHAKDIEMRLRSELHRHAGLAVTEAPSAEAVHPHAPNGVSLLRLSVPARLLLVAVAAALLWAAVFWALQ